MPDLPFIQTNYALKLLCAFLPWIYSNYFGSVKKCPQLSLILRQPQYADLKISFLRHQRNLRYTQSVQIRAIRGNIVLNIY